MAIIKVENLTYYYPGATKPALQNINLEIDEGAFFLITGPSGSGKSTLIRTFNGLIPHFYEGRFEGKVLINGYDTRSKSVSELSKIVGIVFQDPENQILTLTVEHEVAFGLENLGLPPKEIRIRVEKALNDIRIVHLRERVPIELSTGEQQKVIVASIIAMKPKVLVFDEPTAHMDPVSALLFIETIKKLNDEGYTIIVVEHRLNMIARYASQMIILNEGKIIAKGNPREVLALNIAEEVGVDVPRYMRLFKKLSEYVKVDKYPLHVEEAAEELKKVMMKWAK